MPKFKNSQEAAAKRRELLDRQAEINDKLQVIDETVAKRELKDEEKAEQANLNREFNKLQRDLDIISREYQVLYQAEQAQAAKRGQKKTAGQQLREMMETARKSTQVREVALGTSGTGGVMDSGAVNLTINDIIPTLNEGLGLPSGVTIQNGVTGNEVWPVSIDDCEMEEVGETAELTDQSLNFDNISPSVKRVGITINVSNTAIDNADFDLLAFVQKKITIAQRRYLAMKIYSHAAFSGVAGPFAGANVAGTITIDKTSYATILKEVAKFADLGYDMSQIDLVVDATTEAELKATPKADGQGGFVIENGKLAGYNYVVSHYIDTTLDADGKTLKTDTDRYMGVGIFPYLSVQQHGAVRLTIDPISKAAKNVTTVTVNTSWSITDLSKKMIANGKMKATAFALYKLAEATT
jgi:HK97 family phage major capsid protein